MAPARFPRHVLRYRNQRWAERVGLGDLDEAAWTAAFARFEPLPDNLPKPLALRYHGHQFDVYNPGLGDGRGFLFAQLLDDQGRLLDLGTKGSGTTPWSRGGDGRLTLKGGVREVLATSMLEALGVSTSKTFSLFETGEQLQRNDEPSPTRASVLVRLSHSHVRFGTFQRLAYHDDRESMDALLTYVLANYYPELEEGPKSTRATRLLTEVSRRSAVLAASYMVSGFVHGVLNSDNMSVTGESFDYGPYRFVPTFDSGFVAAYFDHTGLYAFGRQPEAILRNVFRLGAALRLVEPDLALAAATADYATVLEAETARCILGRLGLAATGGETDEALAGAVYAFLEEGRVGYDRFFFDWHGGLAREARALAGPAGAAYRGPAWDALRPLLERYAPTDAASSPSRVAYLERDAPTTLLIDEIESIWDAIAQRDDWGPFEAKVAEIAAMPVL